MVLKLPKAVNKTWFSNNMNRQNQVRPFSSNTQRGTEMTKGKMTPKREKTESLQIEWTLSELCIVRWKHASRDKPRTDNKERLFLQIKASMIKILFKWVGFWGSEVLQGKGHALAGLEVGRTRRGTGWEIPREKRYLQLSSVKDKEGLNVYTSSDGGTSAKQR